MLLLVLGVPCGLALVLEGLRPLGGAGWLLAALPPPGVSPAVLGLAGLLGLWFHRGRAFHGLLLLGLADALLQHAAALPAASPVRAAVYDSVSLLLPLLLAALCLLPERSLASAGGAFRLGLASVLPLGALWAARPGQAWLAPYRRLELWRWPAA